MGIVTRKTHARRHRGVLYVLIESTLVMTGVTEPGGLVYKEFFVIGRMGVMATRTHTPGHRHVDRVPLKHGAVMTHRTEIGTLHHKPLGRCSFRELEGLLAVGRGVTGLATHAYGGMNDFAFCLVRMTHGAVGAIGGQTCKKNRNEDSEYEIN
jgi:hypothetical protein